MGRAVLLVEDDFLLGMDLEDQLARRGWQVVGPVTTVLKALDVLEHGTRPDVAILDMMLQDGLATPLAEALHARGVPFVVVSAWRHADRLAGGALRGAPTLRKPVDPDDLALLLEATQQAAGKPAN